MKMVYTPVQGSTRRVLCTSRQGAAAPSSSTSVPSALRSAYVTYDGLLQSMPITTTATGALLALLGDAFTQAATSTSYDFSRGMAFGLFGATVTGPVNHVWLNRLNDIVFRIAPRGGISAVVAKVAIQSAFFQPMVYVPLFFIFTAVFRAWSWDQMRERVTAEYPGTLKSLWLFWTPICFFTFAVLPVRQQAIFFSGVSLCWNASTCARAHVPIGWPSLPLAMSTAQIACRAVPP